VFITGFADHAVVDEAHAGWTAVVLKPFEPESLVLTLHDLLGDG
jgi:CheY-like chemotaxis protein